MLLLAYCCIYWCISATTGLLLLVLAYCCYYWHTAANIGILLLLLANCCYYWPAVATISLLLLILVYCYYYWPTTATTGLLLIPLDYLLLSPAGLDINFKLNLKIDDLLFFQHHSIHSFIYFSENFSCIVQSFLLHGTAVHEQAWSFSVMTRFLQVELKIIYRKNY